MAIPSVMQGLIETEDGKVFELDSPKGAAWLETIGSFRYEPTGDGKSYTVRKEASAYWYGCRKVARKVRKKYIGKSSDVSIAKLEEIAEALEMPPVPRADKVVEVVEVAEQVTEVAEQVTEVAEQVTEVAQDRLTVLESQVANLQKALEALQEALPGKFALGDYLELPKVDNEVAERLQNELGNLKDENEKLRADYAALLESSTVVADNLRRGVRELQARLEVERADREELQKEFDELNKQYLDKVFVAEALQDKKSATASELPEAADLLNQLKTRRKKSNASLADIEAILGMIEESCDDTSQEN